MWIFVCVCVCVRISQIFLWLCHPFPSNVRLSENYMSLNDLVFFFGEGLGVLLYMGQLYHARQKRDLVPGLSWTLRTSWADVHGCWVDKGWTVIVLWYVSQRGCLPQNSCSSTLLTTLGLLEIAPLELEGQRGGRCPFVESTYLLPGIQPQIQVLPWRDFAGAIEDLKQVTLN